MDTRNLFIARRRARGAIKLETVAIVAIVAALAVAAYFLIIRRVIEQRQLEAGGLPPVAGAVAGNTNKAVAPANLQELDVNQLLDEASKALKDQRYLAPAGDNAFEFYLRVLAKQPNNPVATSALRETFPYAASDAEQAINSRNFDEAQREIDLLAKADPANFTLTILRSKLDAQRKLADQQQQQAQDQQKAAQLAAQKAATEKAAADKQAELQQQQLAAEQAKAKQQQVAEQHAAAESHGAQPASPAAAANTQTSEAVLVKAEQARYPTSALRAGLSGWVQVAFTITKDGRTKGVHVIDAQPRHVFDRAAMEAIDRYRFKPAMRDGNPVESESQQKVVFSTGR
jgi:protein TonB